jgi:F420-0:gamma-glutamyl ligase
MNIQALNSRELDAIYDALRMHIQCIDDDDIIDVCHNIISKMHIHCIMNPDEVWIIKYKELRMNCT